MSSPTYEMCLGPKEVAAILGLSARTVTRMMREGELLAFRAGRKQWRTTLQQVTAYQKAGFARQCAARPHEPYATLSTSLKQAS